MKAIYWQDGKNLDYTNSTNAKIEANTILVVGDIVGVAGTDIEAGETGSVITKGVFEMPKKDSTATTQGTKVYFDTTDGITATAGTLKQAGYAAADSAAGDTAILVKLLG